MPRPLIRWIRRLVILAVLAAGGWYGYQWYAAKKDPPPEYRTSPVTRTNLTRSVTASGQLMAVVMVQVGSQISGVISKLNADFNSPVKAGDIVGEIDPATYKANLAQNEGELANAEAELELARLNANRKKQLHAKDLAPAADYDKAMADLKQAEARVKIRNASLDKVRVDLARCTIYAPIDGVVISRKVDVGQTVAASFNAPVLFEIAKDLSHMQIHANVAEADIGGVAEGQEVEFRVDAFDQLFKGTVQQVRNAPTTLENIVTYITVIDVENPDLKLKPGMTANVTIILDRRKDVVTAPNAALRFRPDLPPSQETEIRPREGGRDGGGRERSGREGGGREGGGREGGRPRTRERRDTPSAGGTGTVYVISKPGNATTTPELTAIKVQMGISDGARTEILSGLTEGQELVTGTVAKDSVAPANPSSPFGGGGGGRRF